jgi:hypothetical protein
MVPATTANAPKANTTARLSWHLARRRLNVLWAMLRDNTLYQPTPGSPGGGLTTRLRIDSVVFV